MTRLATAPQGVQINNGASRQPDRRRQHHQWRLAGAGNLISGNGDSGIAILRGNEPGSNDNTILGNFIGTDIVGANPVGNHDGGIRIVESSANTVGGETSGTGNLISGNLAGSSDQGDGITIIGSTAALTSEPANSNTIIGNVIGLALSRTTSTGQDGKTLGNAGNGVAIEQTASGNLIGVDSHGSVFGNIISGDGGDGVLITGPHATQNSVQANFIGTDGSAQYPLANANGVVLGGGASYNTIGGMIQAARNVISGNLQAGVVITDAGTNFNQVLNDLIGMEGNGSVRLDNRASGVLIENQASSNTIGTTGAGNVISGNVGNGIEIAGAGTSDNNVFANLIGVDADGDSRPNDGDGVLIQNAANNHIGGMFGATVQGNTIDDNFDAGVFVTVPVRPAIPFLTIRSPATAACRSISNKAPMEESIPPCSLSRWVPGEGGCKTKPRSTAAPALMKFSSFRVRPGRPTRCSHRSRTSFLPPSWRSTATTSPTRRFPTPLQGTNIS